MFEFRVRDDTPLLSMNFFLDNIDFFLDKSIVFVGARAGSMEYKVCHEFRKRGNKKFIGIVEIFNVCVRSCKEESHGDWITFHGDGRFMPFRSKSIDVVAHIQGPEHLDEIDIIPTFRQYEDIARLMVVTEHPRGEYKQGDLYHNPWEVHRSHLNETYFGNLGYTTHIAGYSYEKLRHVFSYKTLEST